MSDIQKLKAAAEEFSDNRGDYKAYDAFTDAFTVELILTLIDRLESAEKALKPFAATCDEDWDGLQGDDPVSVRAGGILDLGMTVEEFRAARAHLSQYGVK